MVQWLPNARLQTAAGLTAEKNGGVSLRRRTSAPTRGSDSGGLGGPPAVF